LTGWRRLVGAAALSAGVIAAPLAYRTSHASLAPALERGLARLTRLPPSAIHVEVAELRAPARLAVRGLRVGPWRAAAIDLDADLAALVGSARARVGSGRARDVDLGALGRAADVELRRAGALGRVTARDVAAVRAGVPVAASTVAVEWASGHIERAAFTGLALGGAHGFHELTGHAWREGAGFRVRAARPGLELTGHVEGAVLEAHARLEQLPLDGAARWVRGAGLQLERAAATGELDVRQDAVETRAEGTLRLDDLVLDQPSLARRKLGPLSVTLSGGVALAAPSLTVEDLRVQLGPIDARLAGKIDPRAFELDAELAPVGCAQALRALPADLLPALDGLTLDGQLAGRARLAGELARLSELKLDAALDVGCRVLDDPPLADARSLNGPVTARGDDGHGKERTFVLFSPSPSFRPLASLPEHVVRAFVIAEDGRFFQHHGFDLDMIRKALAQDLGAGRFERGASTITQQVAKNLFLSGERTAARKLEEAVLAWRMEQVVPKRRILELYLNLVELGPGVYGVTEAAERYFGKLPDELTADEAAQLAALLPAPRHGMDATWQRRYRALIGRLPSEKLTIPPGVTKLAARAH
jgi:hypothetical protein